MNKIGPALIGLFGAIITLAIISVIISRKSRAPEAIQALASGVANVVAAAVDPSTAQTRGHGAQAFTTVAGPGVGSFG